MKKLLATLCTISLLSLAAHAADGEKKEADAPKKPELTAEQKALKKEFTDKYDTNKDGKLSKEERAAMSAEDKAKWDAAFPHAKKKTEGGETKSESKTNSVTK